MKNSFKTLLALSAAALLAACGGGSSVDTTTPPASQPEWASPAMFVPAGQSQISVAVSSCSANNRSSAARLSTPQLANTSIAVTSPSLVITSAGDVIFSGVIAPATSVTELARVNFANATINRSIFLSSTPSNNSFYVESATGSIGFTEGNFANALSAISNQRQIYCDIIADLTPAYAPSEARLADKFTAGATGWRNTSNSNATATFVNNQFTWDNLASGNTLPANQTSARFAGLNVATGVLSVGPAQATQSVALSAAAASGGTYAESFEEDKNVPQRFIKGALLNMSTASQGILRFNMEVANNVIFVTPELGDNL